MAHGNNDDFGCYIFLDEPGAYGASAPSIPAFVLRLSKPVHSLAQPFDKPRAKVFHSGMTNVRKMLPSPYW